LVLARPATPAQVFINALVSPQTSSRQNAAWALGMMHAAASALLPLLKSGDPVELKEVLLALSRCSGEVPAKSLLPFLYSAVPTVRAAAALALATHQPEVAATAVPDLLRRDEQQSAADYAKYVARGKPKLTQAEIDPIVEEYREHMKLIHAIEMLPPQSALPLLTPEAFRSAEDPSHVTSLLAGYGLWDRIEVDPSAAITALESPDIEVADRAEWILVKANASVLPIVRDAVPGAAPAVRRRLIYVLAWQGDGAALPLLHDLQRSDAQDRDLIAWAIAKIQTLQIQP